MKKIEAARLASALAQVSNTALPPKKGLRFYRFYMALKSVQTELGEYEQKLRNDYAISEDADAETIRAYNEALAEMCNEEADIKVEPFLTEEELFTAVEKVMTMEGIAMLVPMIVE